MDLINPALDVVFKMLLLRDERLLRSMIEAVLGLTEPLAAVEVLNPEIPQHFHGDHGVVLDVRVRLGSGEEVDLEMATRGDGTLPSRLLFYWARHFSSQLPRGAEYKKLVPLRLILWTVRSVLPDVGRFHERFRVVGEHSSELFAPHLEIHVLDLTQLDRVSRGDDPRLRRWGRFFVLADDRDATLLAQEDPIMSLAVKHLQHLSSDPVARRIADDRERDLLAHGHVVASARDEGIALGKEAGLALGKEEGLALGEGRTLLLAIETVAELLGIELTAARRRELEAASLAELRERLAQLRQRRAWV